MQELLEKRAKNREKQRIWRERNLERSKEIKRLSNYKSRGYVPQPRVFTERPPKRDKPGRPRKSPSIHESDFKQNKEPDIEVSLCMTCYRKYLPKLYCLWCNDKNYGRPY